jgi:arabinofuranan 3-O-arabinosyltransferase
VPPGRVARASASSTWTSEPVGRPQAALDRDPSTSWWAGATDPRPTLRIALAERTVVSWLRIQESLGLAASRPLGVTVKVGSRAFPLTSDEQGYVRFPATATSTIELTIDTSRPQLSYDTTTGTRSVLPVGISELVLGEADAQRRGLDRAAAVAIPCGFGPTVRVGAADRVLTRVDTTIGALLDGRPSTARPCTAAALPAGTRRVVTSATGEFWVGSLRWAASPGATAARPVTSPRVVTWSSTDRVVEVAPASSVRTLELAENANAGWSARWEGGTLAPVRVDGWRQAWLLPPGVSGRVEITYAPDQLFRAALVVGALCLLLLVALAVVRPRRARDWSLASPPPPPVRTGWRLLGTGLVALVALGPVGAASALAASRIRAQGFRLGVASLGVVAAVAGAVAAPWPASTLWQPAVDSTLALVTSAATGAVLGCLVGPGRRRRRSDPAPRTATVGGPL